MLDLYKQTSNHKIVDDDWYQWLQTPKDFFCIVVQIQDYQKYDELW